MQLLVPVTNPAALAKSQQAFDFDADAHPRASAGSPKGGQFVRREDGPEKFQVQYRRHGQPIPETRTVTVPTDADDQPPEEETYVNTEDGVKSYVVPVPGGFSVSVQDIDSGEFLPSIPIYPTRAMASEKAKLAAFGSPALAQPIGHHTQTHVPVRAPSSITRADMDAMASQAKAWRDRQAEEAGRVPPDKLPYRVKKSNAVLVPVTNPAALQKGQGSFDFDEAKHPRGEKGSGQGGKFVAKDHSDEELHQHWQDAHQQKKTLDKQRAKGKVNYEDHFHQSQALDTKKRQIEAELSDRRIAEHNRQREEADKHELDVDAETGKIRTDPNTGSMWRRKVNKSLAVLVPITLR